MSEREYDHIFYCDRGMSLSEYKELLDIIQVNHPFPSMPSGANVKYVDSDISIQTILDTRDASLFNFRMLLRGFGYVLFTEQRGMEPGDPKKATITGKTMYQSVLDYVSTKGSIELHALSSTDIGKLRGMRSVFGTYSGRRVTEEMVAEFPFVEHLLGSMDTNMFAVRSSHPGYGDDKTTGFLLFNDVTQRAKLYNTRKELVFKGRLMSMSDLMHALRITEIPQSF